MEQIEALIKEIKARDIKDFIIAIAIILLFYIMSSWFSKIVMKIFKIKEKDRKKMKQSSVYKGLKDIFMCIGFYLALVILNLPLIAHTIIIKLIRIIVVINIARILVGMISPDSKIMRKFSESDKFSQNKPALKLINKVIKFVIYIIAAFIIITDLGYDLSGLVTGLGLGSVVIALAAQELVSNMLSGMAIASEEPFKVGDYVTIGDISGTIIEIKFRSVKIKTVEKTIVTIQNSKILEEAIINSASIDSRRLDFSIRLPLDTTASKTVELMESIRRILINYEEVKKETIQINVDEIKEDAIVVKVYMYLSIVDYAKFLSFKTELNLEIMRLLENKNIKLAYPSSDIYINNR